MDDTWLLSKLYQLLGRRPKTIKEVSDWLTKRKVPTYQQARLISHLVQLQLLNDREFTHAFIRTQKLIKPLSLKEIVYKLQKKGISPDMTKQVLKDEGHDELAAATREVQKHMWKWEKLEPRARKQKQIEFLARKGFSFDIAKKANE